MLRRYLYPILFMVMSLTFVGLWVHAHGTSASCSVAWGSNLGQGFCRTTQASNVTYLMSHTARTVNVSHNIYIVPQCDHYPYVCHAIYGYTHIIQGVGTRSTGNVAWEVNYPGETDDPHYYESSWVNVPSSTYDILTYSLVEVPIDTSGKHTANDSEWKRTTVPCSEDY